MKKLLVLLLALCLVCGLAACGEKEAPSFDITDLQHKSGVITEALISGDYAAVTAYFDAAMSKALIRRPAGAMRARCSSIISCVRCSLMKATSCSWR